MALFRNHQIFSQLFFNYFSYLCISHRLIYFKSKRYMTKKNLRNFASLLEIMADLREKCPWDREQTMLSLRTNTIEECFELVDSILNNDKNAIKEELGDVLLHIVFYSKIAEEEKSFDIGDVIEALCEKLIYRHPHIYSTTEVSGVDDVKSNWEALKQKKKKSGGLLSGVPRSMPALPKATRIGEKAASVGFDWEKREDVWAKVKEEISELEVEMRVGEGNREKIESEFGDVFFALTNAARLYGIDPETALERTNKKFSSRFTYLEDRVRERGVSLRDLSLAEMDEIWDEAKGLEDK